MPSDSPHPTSPNLPRSSKTTIYIRLVVLILDVISIILLLTTIALFYTWPTHHLHAGDDWTDFTLLGLILLSLTWTLFILLRPVKTTKPLHPGHTVAYELLLWLFLLAGTLAVICGGTVLDAAGTSEQVNNCWIREVEEYERDAWRCEPRVMVLQKMQISGISFGLGVGVLHFVLFVRACRVCERFNRGRMEMLRIPEDGEVERGKKGEGEV